MKKTLLVVCLVMAMVAAMAGIAAAEGWYTGFEPTHYNFSLTTEGCAGCHVTHTAEAKYLLIAGPSQTDFCYVCHATLLASPYDVEKGEIRGNDATTRNSTAGGFNLVPQNVFAATSIHNVEPVGSVAVNTYAVADIPGTTLGAELNFRCGSCHDPHAGDKPNDRLLRDTIGGVTVSTVNFVYDGSTLLVTDYAFNQAANTGLNDWCGLCHGKFDVGDDAGKTPNGGRYRHAMGVAVDPTRTTLDNYLGVKNAAANAANNYLNCLTCHYAHGSDKAKMETYTSWERDGGVNYTETDSTLLRMDKRGVCYDCHGAAADNLESYGQVNS